MIDPMNKLVIGIVGGIGSGKSAAAAALARHGGKVVAGDPAGHAALRDPVIRQKIAARWPPAINSEGQVDRKILGRIVFADPVQLCELEALVFPWIKSRLQEEINAAKADPDVRYIVLDAAVMLEAGWASVCDKLVFVDAPREARVARVASRGWSADELDCRERAQMSLDEKRRRADAILANSGDFSQLQRLADDIMRNWGLITSATKL